MCCLLIESIARLRFTQESFNLRAKLDIAGRLKNDYKKERPDEGKRLNKIARERDT